MNSRKSETPLDKEEWRQRSYHTRSRNGCLACRKRHRRCDEQKPVCKACSTRSLPCRYEDGSHDNEVVIKAEAVLGPMPIDLILSHSQQDPFNTLPIPQQLRDGEALGKFVVHMKEFERTMPRRQVGIIDLRTDRPAYLTGMLLWILTRDYAMGSTSARMTQSICHLRTGMIKELQVVLEKDAGTGDVLMGHRALMTGMFIIDSVLDDAAAADAHFRAVFAISDMRTRRGQGDSRLDQRNMLMHIGFMHAAKQASIAGSAALSRCYVTAANNFGFIQQDYQCEYPLHNAFDRVGSRRLLWWLVATLRADRERAKRLASGSIISEGKASSASRSPEGAVQVCGHRLPPVQDDIWAWKLAAVGIVLAAVTAPPVPAENKQATPTERSLWELKMWTDRAIEEWRKAPRVLEWAGAEDVLGKILWLMETDEGIGVLELISRLWSGG